jgi:hypothetical protein
MPYRAEDAESCLMWWFYRIWYVLCICERCERNRMRFYAL